MHKEKIINNLSRHLWFDCVFFFSLFLVLFLVLFSCFFCRPPAKNKKKTRKEHQKKHQQITIFVFFLLIFWIFLVLFLVLFSCFFSRFFSRFFSCFFCFFFLVFFWCFFWWSGMAASRCLERYLFFSYVLRFWLWFASHYWQIALELLHQGCGLNVHEALCFFGYTEVPLRRKIGSHARRGRRRRFAVESVSNCARNVTGSKWLFLVSLCALEMLHQSDAFYSSVLQFYCVVRLSLRRSQRNGCSKVSRCCGCVRNTIVFSSAPENRKSYCSRCMKVANGA